MFIPFVVTVCAPASFSPIILLITSPRWSTITIVAPPTIWTPTAAPPSSFWGSWSRAWATPFPWWRRRFVPPLFDLNQISRYKFLLLAQELLVAERSCNASKEMSIFHKLVWNEYLRKKCFFVDEWALTCNRFNAPLEIRIDQHFLGWLNDWRNWNGWSGRVLSRPGWHKWSHARTHLMPKHSRP